MADAKQEYLPKAETNVRIRGAAVFPKLTTPDTKFNAMGSFKTGVRVEGEAAATLKGKIDAAIDAAFEAAAVELLRTGEGREKDGEILLLKDGKPQKSSDGKSLKVLTRTDRPYKEELNDEGEETGAIVFNTKTSASYKDKKTGRVINKKVTIVDAKKQKVTKEVWGGSLIVANVDIKAFHTNIGVGVSLRLNGVQVIELRSGGRTADAMFDEEEGYTDDGQSPEAPQVEGGDAAADDDIPL
jgi:hypothetical protein